MQPTGRCEVRWFSGLAAVRDASTHAYRSSVLTNGVSAAPESIVSRQTPSRTFPAPAAFWPANLRYWRTGRGRPNSRVTSRDLAVTLVV